MPILKSLSSGKSTKKAGASPATSSGAAGMKLPGKLPLIGHLPVAQQLRIPLSVLGAALLTATALAFLQNREAARTIHISASTEMAQSEPGPWTRARYADTANRQWKKLDWPQLVQHPDFLTVGI